jgi:hypothetical protein
VHFRGAMRVGKFHNNQQIAELHAVGDHVIT